MLILAHSREERKMMDASHVEKVSWIREKMRKGAREMEKYLVRKSEDK